MLAINPARIDEATPRRRGWRGRTSWRAGGRLAIAEASRGRVLHAHPAMAIAMGRALDGDRGAAAIDERPAPSWSDSP